MAAAISSFAGTLSPTPAERRLKLRYPLGLSVRFRSLSTGSGIYGEGHTVNLSSGGILVVSQDVSQYEIHENSRVEMSIEWPFLLDGKVPLQLFALGRIIRSGAWDFAATFVRYEFRTMRASS
jgi:hypothetical protein